MAKVIHCKNLKGSDESFSCTLLSGCCPGSTGSRKWRKHQSTWLSFSSRPRNSAAYVRPSTGSILQSSASAALLCDDEGRVQAGGGFLLRHFFLLTPNDTVVQTVCHSFAQFNPDASHFLQFLSVIHVICHTCFFYCDVIAHCIILLIHLFMICWWNFRNSLKGFIPNSWLMFLLMVVIIWNWTLCTPNTFSCLLSNTARCGSYIDTTNDISHFCRAQHHNT